VKLRGATSFEGSSLASGIVVGGPGTRRERARERVMALWSPGATVHSLSHDRYLLLFAAPVRLRAREALGAVVVASHGVLSTVPLDVATIAELDPAPGALVEARAGELVLEPLRDASRIDVSDWLEPFPFDVRATAPLGPEPARALAPVSASGDVRAALGERIPARADGAKSLAELFGGRGDRAMELPPRAASWLRSIVRWARDLFAAGRAPEPSTSADLVPRREGIFARLRSWLGRVLFQNQLSRWLARRHAEYVVRMLELFDRGDIREALKWAIPLGGEGETGNAALASPQPRGSLAITLRAGTGGTIAGPPGLYELLRARYLDVLAKLQAAGSIDEAAFVLAELLRDPAAAVAYLERNERYLQAARLADAASLEPPVRVRTWMLAGDVDRAILIARQHGGMPLAITMLRRGHPAAADALALTWASMLADAGAHAEAVDVARPIEGSAALVRAWIEIALEVGGVTRARMLASRASLSPERWDDTRARVLALLDDGSPENEKARQAFARALSGETASPAVRTLARPALRAILRDGASTSEPTLAARLEAVAKDAALRADRPRTPAHVVRPPLTSRASPLIVRVDARDVGSIGVKDAALLPSGRMALALGEAGVRLVSPDGRNVGSFDTPADALVLSDSGARALAVARRGSIARIARIDLIARRSEPWWEAHLVSFARTFDGASWLVSERGTAQLVDALDTGWTALTRIAGEPCAVVDRCREGTELALFTVDDGGMEWWRYDATLSRLRLRGGLTHALAGLAIAQVAADTSTWTIGLSPDDGSHHLVRTSDASPVVVRLDGTPIRGSLVSAASHVALATSLSIGVRVDLRSATGQPLLHVLLDGATQASLRLTADVLVVADDRGRVLAIDVMTGAVLRDLRVRA
jgi:hypothetical protein